LFIASTSAKALPYILPMHQPTSQRSQQHLHAGKEAENGNEKVRERERERKRSSIPTLPIKPFA
jgi:hypothetical protein